MSKKIQYANSFGLDLSQVVAWQRVDTPIGEAVITEADWDLELYISGSKIRIAKKTLGGENFNNLLQSLIEEFSPRSVAPIDERVTTITS